MTNLDLRNKWIKFFQSRGHLNVSDRSIIPPASDTSLLFINSGVAAIKSYFYGDSECPNRRLVSCQKVVRTGDIDLIQTSYRHHTYFEMLGNFSIGDYFKKEAIEWSWDFLINHLKLDPKRLYVTIFKDDIEALNEWKLWISEDRIVLGDDNTNFWNLGVGPCGPCTEIYYDKGPEYDPDNLGLDLLRNNIENNRFLEIWNIVFSEFLNVDGKIIKNSSKNIDTGAGLERLVAVIEGKDNNFQTSLFSPIIEYFLTKFGGSYEYYHALADYIRTSALLINDGIGFGNKGREHVLRKIFRKLLSLIPDLSLVSETLFLDLVNIIAKTLPYYQWNIQRISKSMVNEFKLFTRVKAMTEEGLFFLLEKYDEKVPEEEIFKLVAQEGADYLIIKEKLFSLNRTFSEERYTELQNQHKLDSTNSSISSAFVKKHPSLISLDVESEMDYDSKSLKSTIVAVFDSSFNRVESLDGRGYVVLDKTIIFPLASGQDSDDGFIDNKKVLTSIKGPNGQIIHELEGNYKVGDVVLVSIDLNKRSMLEKHHTLEHLFYELLKREVNSDIKRVSGFKNQNYLSIEISVPQDLTKSSFDIKYLDKKLKELIDSSLSVEITYMTLEEYRKQGLETKFDRVYEKFADSLRFVNIGGYSRELCAGTHVSNTSEIEDSLIVSFKKKSTYTYKFKLVGGLELVNLTLSSSSGSRESYLSSITSDLIKARVKESSEDRMKWVDRLLDFEGPINIVEEPLDPKFALSIFKLLSGKLQNQTVCLFFKDSSETKFFIASDSIDISLVIERLKKNNGAKGGGNKKMGSGIVNIPNFSEFIRLSLLEDLN